MQQERHVVARHVQIALIHIDYVRQGVQILDAPDDPGL